MSDSKTLNETIERLLGQLDAPLADLRDAAQQALVEIGEPAVEPLLRAVEHPRRELRVGAALTLGRLGDERALPGLSRLASDPDATLHPIALRALSDIANPDASDALKVALLRELRHDDMFVRALACRGLGRIGDAVAKKALALAAEDPEKWVRDAAHEALAPVGALTTSPNVQGGDQTALARREGAAPSPHVAGLASLDPKTQKSAQDALVAEGERVVPQVARMLWSAERSTRRAAAEVLGRVGSAQAVEALAQMLENDALEPQLRAAALHALGRAATTSATRATATAQTDDDDQTSHSDDDGFPVELVEAHLEDPDVFVRAAAVVALIGAGGPRRRVGVAALIDDEEEWVHVAGLRALTEVAGPDDRLLRDALVDGMTRITDSGAQAHLLISLAKIVDPPRDDDQVIVGPASFFFEHEEDVVRQAALVLVLRAARQLDGALLTRIHELLDVDPDAEGLVAGALARFASPGDEASLPLLLQLLRSPNLRVVESVAGALGRIGGLAAIDALVSLANGSRSTARLAAEVLDSLDPDTEVIAACDDEGRWQRELQPRCECGSSLEWRAANQREELRCPSCDLEYVLAANGRRFRVDLTPFGACLCCKRKQPLVRGGRGQTLVCPTTQEVHVRPHDAPRQVLRLSDLPLGGCQCCPEMQPLVPVGQRVVCRRTRREHEPGPEGHQLPSRGRPAVAADINAINQALLAGSLGIGESGVPLAGTNDDED